RCGLSWCGSDDRSTTGSNQRTRSLSLRYQIRFRERHALELLSIALFCASPLPVKFCSANLTEPLATPVFGDLFILHHADELRLSAVVFRYVMTEQLWSIEYRPQP